MDSERREHILRAVVEVIEKLRRQLEAGLDRQVIDFDLLPTDLDAIATSLGLKVKIENELDGSTALASETLGAVYRKRKEIQIAGGKKHTRQRFTLAHELGHYLLHDQLVSYREVLAPSEAVDATNRPAIEQEADFFAVELLMPARSVGRVFQQYFGGPINGTVASDDVAHFSAKVTVRFRLARLCAWESTNEQGCSRESLLMRECNSSRYAKSLMYQWKPWQSGSRIWGL